VEATRPYQDGIVKQVSDWVSSPQYASSGASPDVVAERIVEAIDRTGFMAGKKIGLRLPLGKDTGASTQKRVALLADLANLKDVWGSV
jgi:hypothetical protein